MRVELTQEVIHRLTKGNIYEASPDVAGYVTIRATIDVVVPTDFYRMIPIKLFDGTELEEGAVYDVTYRQPYGTNKGKPKTLRSWRLVGQSGEQTWREPRLYFVHQATEKSYGGKSQEIAIKDIESAVKVG